MMNSTEFNSAIIGIGALGLTNECALRNIPSNDVVIDKEWMTLFFMLPLKN